jgi:hypothetical protein
MAELPLVMTPNGLAPILPATIRTSIEVSVSQTNPDYTSNLPGTLIEDVLSTEIAGVVQADQFLIDLVNSVTPKGANPFLLNQLGQIYGVNPQIASNPSVYVVFNGPPGFIIGQGFTVSDTVYQYVCTAGGVIGAADETGVGATLPLYAVATQPGIWSITANTVNELVTSVPVGYDVSVNNPEPGLSVSDAETETAYRSRVLRAGLAASTGMSRYLKTLLNNVPGVQERLVSVQQNLSTHLWTILVGGGDPYQVAYAIYYALFNLIDLDQPPIYISGITSGPTTTITNLNGGWYQVTFVDLNNIHIPADSTAWPAYTGGGDLSPNPINAPTSVVDYPDTYTINFVNPPPERVRLTVNWRTAYTNYVSQASVASVVAPALASYINSIPVGKSPINIYDMTTIFLDVTSSLMPSDSVTVLEFTVIVDGVSVAPDPGTGAIYGDPYMFFLTSVADIVVTEI